MTKRLILFGQIATAIAAYFLFDLGQILTLENFKAQQAELV
jgi:hypothetical protein